MSYIIDSLLPDVWGYVKEGVSAHEFTGGTGNPNVCQDGDGAGTEFRGLWSFDTSGIPDGCVIDSVEWYNALLRVELPIGYSGTYVVRLHWDHDIIGGSIAVGDFGFPDGNVFGTKTWTSTPANSSYYSIFTADFSCVNKGGDTDVEMRCISSYTDPPGAPYWKFKTMQAGPTWFAYLKVGYNLQGALNKTPSGNIGFYGGMCLAALSKFLMQSGIIPPNSEVDRVDGSDIHVVTRFVPRTVMGACS